MCSQMLYSCCHFLGLEQSTSICLDCAISDHLLTSAKDILNMDDMSSLSLILFSLRLCVGLSHKIAILGGSNMKTRHSVRTVMAHCCVVFCTNDWRYKDEYRERTGEELHFHQFPVTVDKKWKSGSTVIDSKFAKLLCHTEPTLRNRLVLVVSVLYVLAFSCTVCTTNVNSVIFQLTYTAAATVFFCCIVVRIAGRPVSHCCHSHGVYWSHDGIFRCSNSTWASSWAAAAVCPRERVEWQPSNWSQHRQCRR